MTDIDPFDALPDNQTARRGSGRLLVGAMLVIAIFAAFSVTAWFAYNRGFYSASDELAPIVRAEDGPTRVRPDAPGGLDIPDQDKLVFDRIAPGQAEPTVERLLPEPEQPLPASEVAVSDATDPVVTETVDDIEQPVADAAAAIEDAVEEAIEDTVAVAPPPPIPGAEIATATAGDDAEPDADGGLDLNDVLAAISNELPGTGADAPADPSAADAGAADAPADASADVAALDAPAEIKVESAEAPAVAPPTVESVPIPEPPAVETAAATPPAEPAPAVVPANGDSAWRVQLASVRDEAGAAREWDRLKSRHPELLGALVLNIQSADLAAGRFYRIQAGPVADRDAARKLCADLASVNQDCLVVQP